MTVIILAACAAKPGTIDWANKPDAPPAKVKDYLPSTAPEEQGMESAKVEAWVKALDGQVKLMHGFVLLRHGRLVAEGCWATMAPFDLYGFLTSRGKPCYEGEPMSAVRFASVMKRMCGMVEARASVIGYVQRGAEPTARDSTFAFEAGNLAVRLLRDGISNQVIGMQKGKVMYMPIDKALAAKKNFNRNLYDLVNSL